MLALSCWRRESQPLFAAAFEREELVLRERADEQVVVAEVVTNADAREHLADVAIALGQLHQVAHDGAERAREGVRTHERDLGAGIFQDARSDGMALGAIVLRTETELILKSRRVVPARLLEGGFTFRYASWPEAARDLCAGPNAVPQRREVI